MHFSSKELGPLGVNITAGVSGFQEHHCWNEARCGTGQTAIPKANGWWDGGDGHQQLRLAGCFC
jgi:hypothetical protein